MEKSCGAVVFTRTEEGVRYVLVQSSEGKFGFPKGHMEKSETEEELLCCLLVPYEKALELLPHNSLKQVLQRAEQFLQSK